ncbi:ATP-binding domain-containing protein [Nonomuraea antimicrobica]
MVGAAARAVRAGQGGGGGGRQGRRGRPRRAADRPRGRGGRHRVRRRRRRARGRPGQGAEALDAPVTVMGVADAKGLEFDSVIVAEPDLIAAQSPRGPSDLYVALTRATQRLGVVHERPLSPALRGLPTRSTSTANGL